MQKPFVSVILPVYNGERFLADAIQSVKNQNHQPLEIIVVDDGSTDGTAAVAARFKDEIHYVYQSNQGPAAARNHAIAVAKGDIYAFIDADDQWVDGVFDRLLQQMVAQPTASIVRGLIQETAIYSSEAPSSADYCPELRDGTYYGVNLGSALFRRSAFETVGLFDSSLHQGEDFDWFVRAWERKLEKFDLDAVFLVYRKHDANITRDRNQVRSGIINIYKRHIDRLRSSSASAQTTSEAFPTITQYLRFKSL
jgi:glycosyltransferase involved in cell wall biosynthesis